MDPAVPSVQASGFLGELGPAEPPDNTGCSVLIASMEGQVDGAAQSSRHTCPTCGKRKGAYCEDCVVVLEQPAPPQLRLPVKVRCAAGRPAAVTTACRQASAACRWLSPLLPCPPLVLDTCKPSPPPPRPQIDIVQHGETNARSTALHAALLAAADVALHRYADSKTSRRCDPLDLQLPDFDAATTVVLFPEGPQTDVVGQCPPFERVVVLGRWVSGRAAGMRPSPFALVSA